MPAYPYQARKRFEWVYTAPKARESARGFFEFYAPAEVLNAEETRSRWGVRGSIVGLICRSAGRRAFYRYTPRD